MQRSTEQIQDRVSPGWAPHRATLRNHTQFVEAVFAAGEELSTIFNAPGLEVKHAAVDEMHGIASGVATFASVSALLQG